MTFARHLTPVFALTAVLGVAACSEPAPEIAAEGGDVVECALDGSGTFAPDCRLLELPATQGSAWMIYILMAAFIGSNAMQHQVSLSLEMARLRQNSSPKAAITC